MKKSIIISVASLALAGAAFAESTKIKDTGAGLKIGTTATQKIGFYGVTPIVQPTIAAAPTNGADLAEVITWCQGVRSNLVNLGIAKN